MVVITLLYAKPSQEYQQQHRLNEGPSFSVEEDALVLKREGIEIAESSQFKKMAKKAALDA